MNTHFVHDRKILQNERSNPMSYDECFTKLPQIETNRLILRQITDSPSDGSDTLEFINDYDVYRYWGLYDEANDINGRHRPKKKTRLDYLYKSTLSEYHARRELSWLMELKDTHKVIGEIVLYDFHLHKQADIGYRINKEYWGKGFAPEAGQAMVKAAFELLDLNRLQLRCFASNIGSIRVAEKLLFTREGLIREGVIINVVTDYYIYGMLKSDYVKQPISDSIVQIRND